MQGEVIDCMYETYFNPLDKQVSDEYMHLQQDLSRSPNPSTNLNAIQEAQTSLKDAQDFWERYRDNTCEFIWNKNGGQTVNWGDKYNCFMDFDKSRLKTLQRYRQELLHPN